MAAARTSRDATGSGLRRSAGALLAVAALATPLLFATPSAALPQAPGDLTAVSVVVPITLRSGDVGLLDAETLGIATSPAGALTRELDEVLATSATIALDPMVLASIRMLGSAAPESAREWLARLESAPNEVFLLAYADADLTALARADALEFADPLGFGELDPAAFGPPQTPTPTQTPPDTPTAPPTTSPTPTPTDSDDPPPLPTTEDLVAWPGAIGRIAWPAESSVAAADLPAYADAGYEALLLSSSNVSETSSGLVEIAGMPAIVADSAASELFREASTSIDATTRQDAITRLGIALDGLAAAHPGRTIVLTLDRSSAMSSHGLAATYAALNAREASQVVGLSTVLSGNADGARLVDGVGGEHVTRAPELLAAVEAEAAFATILDDPLLLTAPRRLNLLALLAVQDAGTEDWAPRAETFLARSAEILGAVTIVDTGQIFVTSSTTSIPIQIANGLDFPITIQVAARPLRPRLRIESPVTVTIEPDSSKSVVFEAQAITNGKVIIVVSVTSPVNGIPIAQPRNFNADLQAQWETVGIIVGIVLVLVFAVGIVLNVVRRRRAAGLETTEGAARDVEDEA